MKKTLAVFDFDKTITDRDSFNDFLIYEFGIWRFVRSMVRNYELYASIIKKDNTSIKNYMLGTFFAGMKKQEFVGLCENYALCRLPAIIRNKALKCIRWHQQQGHEVIIVTASCDEWIRPWADQNGIYKILASKVQYRNGMITGKLEGRSCYGKEKVNRILEIFPDRNNYIIYAYGDSNGDREMLKFSDHSYYRGFNNNKIHRGV